MKGQTMIAGLVHSTAVFPAGTADRPSYRAECAMCGKLGQSPSEAQAKLLCRVHVREHGEIVG